MVGSHSEAREEAGVCVVKLFCKYVRLTQVCSEKTAREGKVTAHKTLACLFYFAAQVTSSTLTPTGVGLRQVFRGRVIPSVAPPRRSVYNMRWPLHPRRSLPHYTVIYFPALIIFTVLVIEVQIAPKEVKIKLYAHDILFTRRTESKTLITIFLLHKLEHCTCK